MTDVCGIKSSRQGTLSNWYDAADSRSFSQPPNSTVTTLINTATIRALVVDDEEGIRRLAMMALARQGVTCNSASSGQEAMALLEATRYDLVLTDLRMPQGHGHSLCLDILARQDRPVLVVLTGVLEQRLAEDLKARGVDRIYFKPVKFGPLAADLYALIVARRQGQLAPAASDPLPAPAATLSVATGVSTRRHTLPVASPPSGKSDRKKDSSKRPVVAVLRKTRAQSSSLARKFVELGVHAIDLEGVDGLRRLMDENQVRLLIVDNETDGFLTGLEIIRKLRSGSVRIPAVLLDPSVKPLAEEAQSLGLVTLVNSAANNDEIAETGRRVLRRCEEQDDIPEQARALMEGQDELPVMSHVILELLNDLERPPEEIILKDLCRAISQSC
jgi:DNA-binding NtrC family response regulator